MKIAAAQYPIGRFSDFKAWADNAAAWVADAAQNRAQLLVFPNMARWS